MSRYFVTGATGFLGGRILEQLARAGHTIVALARDPDRIDRRAAPGIEWAIGDVTDKESMRGPMIGTGGVFHVAGWYKVGVRDKSRGEAVNVDGTRNVLELMRELQIPKGVYTSTLAVNSDTRGRVVDESYAYHGPHLSEYDRTKAAAHEIAARLTDAGLPLVIVQPGMIYGPGDEGPSHDLFADYLKRRLPVVPKGTAFCWAHVEDVARGHLLAMEKGRAGESYHLAGPVHSLAEVLETAERLTGIPPPRLAAPPWLLRGMSRLMGVVERVVRVPAVYSSETLRVSAGTTYLGDNAKARRELGWEPRELEVGLAETLRAEMEASETPERTVR
ncbi:MAG: NAD-dependent epimerase/dehydratase family protein [Candidatus Eisenbacteria bacterium]|nr:NAD-dependent epimerase/dehydratase family protein [Candidatus Latescibacterota bacterium]MBD3302493.1 NAD-dependent epimerase/dehydratase family protein [Candidatus Eisenbacteria bacterium]